MVPFLPADQKEASCELRAEEEQMRASLLETYSNKCRERILLVRELQSRVEDRSRNMCSSGDCTTSNLSGGTISASGPGGAGSLKQDKEERKFREAELTVLPDFSGLHGQDFFSHTCCPCMRLWDCV